MSSCLEYSVKTLRYLDNDLKGQELEDFLAHVNTCADCRARLDSEQALSQLLKRSRPLYSAPAALRARVSAATARHSPAVVTTNGSREGFWRIPAGLMLTSGQRLRVAAAALIIALCLVVTPSLVRQARAASFVETGVATLRSYVSGNLPTELRASSPELVTAWLSGKVPFHFRLPNAETAPTSTPAYRLMGASLVNYRGSPAALVTYERPDEKISLLVASSESAVVAGGDEVRFGSLTFRYRTESGFKVITWANHGLSYALVSSISGSPRQSCRVCHQDMADKGAFKARN
jgi:anti-sigma factor (TIGR02949 family)